MARLGGAKRAFCGLSRFWVLVISFLEFDGTTVEILNDDADSNIN